MDTYRLVIGHKDQAQGIIESTRAKSLKGAYRALRGKINSSAYPQDMWGRIEIKREVGGWQRIADDCLTIQKIRNAGYII